jgi:two-component system, chemotaxis family, sensor histidine kinase and response regulator PixL
MTDDLDFQESLDRYFEIEAAELLQTIEQTLLSLVEEKTIERVHTLMRAAHTIKGSAANCGFKTIETIAHHLEDVFQALYPAELEIDDELGLLLMEGYDCLYDPLSALLAGVPYDEAATLERTAALFARLQDHLGDFFGRETPLPTAAELGFDVIGSIFTDSIPQDLEVLAEAVAGQNVGKVQESLISLSEFLLELGGSYSLPGIAEIATTTLTALDRNPGQVLAIAQVALTNFQQAQLAILGGDRSIGGTVSAELQVWAESQSEAGSASASSSGDSADWLSLVDNDNADNTEVNLTFADEQVTNNVTDSDNWLSLVDSDNADVTIAFSDEQLAENAEWLSLVESNNSDGTAQDSNNTAAANEWLSMVDAEPAPTAVTDDSADWLSLVDDNVTEPATATEPPVTTADDSADWLSLVDDNATEIETATEVTTADDSADWLSLVDDNSSTSVTETVASDDFVELVDPDLEVDSVASNAGELTISNHAESAYPLAAIEFHQSSELALPRISGIDRIFHLIAMAPPSTEPVEDLQPPAAPDREAQAASAATVRVATIQLERLGHTIGELLIDDNQQFLRAEQLQGMAQSTIEQYRRCEYRLRAIADWSDNSDRAVMTSRTTKGKKKQKKVTTNEAQSQFDSLELDVYSDLSILLQNMTDDLAELGLRVESLAEMTQKSRVTLGKRKQLLADAQAELFEARMVEISTVLNRFPRLLQQMVASHRKPAKLELIGTTVSIDKIIAEKLYDPLLHLIRNAYDHGVESPESRSLQGKSETGQLTIKAYHQGNRTTIEVSDDGQGLNWPKIRQRAIDMKLIGSAQAATATEAELAEIMFAPGFSTAEQVNDLSGRGIGLDVVRDRLGALQGSIDVRSVPGKGTTFTMQFPLNLTTARLLICESQGVAHALRSEAISQVLLPSPDRIQSQTSSMDKGTSKFLRWGDGASQKLIPIYPLNDLLEYHCPIVASEQGKASIFPTQTKNSSDALLLLDIDDEQICLEVNRILVEQELVVKSLGQTFGLPNYIQGYSVLGDGSLTLALDPVELLAQVRNTSAAPKFAPPKFAALQPAIQAALAPSSSDDDTAIDGEIIDTPTLPESRANIGRQMQVLVVDDSLVQRQTLVRSLTKAGCQVIQASHGKEGLLRLQEHPRIRFIVCDIEMPQMNGFEFLSHCRQDPKLAQIPIVMLTTRGGQKHRQLAMTLGAKDYLTKPQSEKELLDIIAKLAHPSEVGV